MNVYVNEQFPYLDFMDIRPGDRVVLKPNLVKEGKETDKNEWKCVVTSPELIRYVATVVFITIEQPKLIRNIRV